MVKAFEELLILTNQPGMYEEKQDAKVIIYIDECQFLTEKQVVVKNSPRKQLDFVTHALETCRRQGLFCILLSTNSMLSQLSVPSNVHPSAREIQAARNLRPPPFVLLGFDLWSGRPIIVERETTLEQVCQLNFLARFGRPL